MFCKKDDIEEIKADIKTLESMFGIVFERLHQLEKEICAPVDKKWNVAVKKDFHFFRNAFTKKEIAEALDIYQGIKEGRYTVFDEEGGQI